MRNSNKSEDRVLPVPEDPREYLHGSAFFENEEDRCIQFCNYLEPCGGQTDRSETVFKLVIQSMNADPCPQIRYWCQGIATEYLHHRESVVEGLTKSLNDYDSMGDLFIWDHAFDLLKKFKPLSGCELELIRVAAVKLLAQPLPEGREVYEHDEFRNAFESFGELCTTDTRLPELYELLSVVVGYEGADITRYLTWMYSWGGIRERLDLVRFILEAGHPDAAKILRLHLLQFENECKEGMDIQKVRSQLVSAGLEGSPQFDELLSSLVSRDTEMFNIIQGFSDEHRLQAEKDKQLIGDLDDYFDCNPVWDYSE